MRRQQVIIRSARGPDKKKREMNPNSLKNLAPPVQPGQILNPTGENGRKRLYTDKYQLIGESIIPEPVRLLFNAKIRIQLQALIDSRALGLNAAERKVLQQEKKREFIPQGTQWAEANSIRLHWEVVMAGDVSAATELREATEGRAEQRIIFGEKNDRLKALIEGLSVARKNPPPQPSPDSADPDAPGS